MCVMELMEGWIEKWIEGILLLRLFITDTPFTLTGTDTLFMFIFITDTGTMGYGREKSLFILNPKLKFNKNKQNVRGFIKRDSDGRGRGSEKGMKGKGGRVRERVLLGFKWHYSFP